MEIFLILIFVQASFFFFYVVSSQPSCGSTEISYEDTYSGRTLCYWIPNGVVNNLIEANTLCQSYNSELAEIPTSSANSAITSLIKTYGNIHDWYYCAYKENSGVITFYLTGQTQTFANWNNAGPSDSNTHCVGIHVGSLNSDAEWYDVDCATSDYRVLCMSVHNISSSTSSLLPSSTAVNPTLQSDGPCNCDCSFYYGEVNMTDELRESIRRLQKELEVDKKKLSSSVRSKTSADDPRPSATYVGAVGVVFLCFAVGGLILLDGEILVQAVQSLMKTCS